MPKDLVVVPSEPPPPYTDNPHPSAPHAHDTSPAGTPGARRPPPGRPPPLNMPCLNTLRRERVVLASASPRRRQLLAQIGLTHMDIVPSHFAEDLSHSLGALNYVLETASAKAQDVYRREIDHAHKADLALVIAADTIIVAHSGRILEKPRGEADHVAMLKMLRDDGQHKVMTAIAVMRPNESGAHPGYRMETHVEETTVWFDGSVSDDLIRSYVRTRDGNDKAGGYGIQTAGSILIEKIEGSYDNVVGLPLRATLKLIEKVMLPEEDEAAGGMFVESDEE
ncbi:hypothetical protein ACEQ8H_004837 [Pleosporales sp. CAS-2024a]